jgi:hypothetical protein
LSGTEVKQRLLVQGDNWFAWVGNLRLSDLTRLGT